MANEKLKVEFKSKLSNYTNCVCNGCHGLGEVIRLELPNTYYRVDGILKTTYDNYWLCRECRDKLVKALEWGEENGK